MDRSDTLDERLAAWIRPTFDGKPFYERILAPGSAWIVERAKGGEAEVECPVPEGCSCIHWRPHKDGLFSFLLEDNKADGALLLRRPDGSYEAHIIECKTTVDQSKWHKVQTQFRWTLGKLLALAGVLGIAISRVTLVTAHRRDLLKEDESSNPTQGTPLLGDVAEQDDDERAITDARRYQLAWMTDQVRLPGFAHPFHHVKIRLDAEGRGTYRA